MTGDHSTAGQLTSQVQRPCGESVSGLSIGLEGFPGEQRAGSKGKRGKGFKVADGGSLPWGRTWTRVEATVCLP